MKAKNNCPDIIPNMPTECAPDNRRPEKICGTCRYFNPEFPVNGITTAEQLIEPLEKAIADMKARPKYYEQFNSPNGWGTYKNFVPWLEKYLAACKEYPDAVVEVSR